MIMDIFIGGLLVLTVIICIILYKKYNQIKFLYDSTNDITNTLLKVSEELREYKNIDELYLQLLDDTIKLIRGAEVGSILIYNKKTDLLEYKAAIGYDMGNLCKVTFKKEELFLYRTKKLVSPDIIKNPRQFDQRYLDKISYNRLQNNKALEMKVCLSAPLYIDGLFYGVINIDNLTDENAFDKNDIRFIQYICRQLEVAITNAMLMNELMDTLKTDKLTGIYNRRYFEEKIKLEIEKAQEAVENQYLVMIDMDNFKLVNDTHGHRVGDEILIYFADVLRKSIGPNDIAARYAGDEFILVIHGGEVLDVEEKMNYIYEYLENNKWKDITTEFSYGICKFEKGMDYDKILTTADNNMYAQKRKRKNSN